MLEKLKEHCKRLVPLTDNELKLIDRYFEPASFNKRDYLLTNGTICNFIAFISEGAIRHFHVKNGVEKTCDLSFSNSWVTDFQSFTHGTSCIMNLQALENSTVFVVTKKNLIDLYKECSKYETFGRLMAEQVAQRATEIAMSLSSDKPEERYLKLINDHPDVLQRVQQKYVANFLGISPESLSRIRKRIVQNRKS
ncbi:MAG: Crp/Fnr family transcriptional regulator [Imperialibacter sp.]